MFTPSQAHDTLPNFSPHTEMSTDGNKTLIKEDISLYTEEINKLKSELNSSRKQYSYLLEKINNKTISDEKARYVLKDSLPDDNLTKILNSLNESEEKALKYKKLSDSYYNQIRDLSHRLEHPEPRQLSDKAREKIEHIYKIYPNFTMFSKLENFINNATTSERDFLFYLHIPKTAGQTFHSIMRSYLDYSYLIKLNKDTLIETWKDVLPFVDEQTTSNDNSKTDNDSKSETKGLDIAQVSPNNSEIDPNNLTYHQINWLKKHMISPQCLNDSGCASRTSKVGFPRFDPHFACSRTIIHALRNGSAFLNMYNKYDVLVGHTDASLMDVLLPRRTHTLTFLRRPFSRFMSWYNYLHTNSRKQVDCMTAWERKIKKMNATYPEAVNDGALAPNITQRPPNVRSAPRCPHWQQGKVYSLEQMHTVSEAAWEDFVLTGKKPNFFQPHSLPYRYTPEKFMENLRVMKLDNYMTKAVSGTLKYSFTQNHEELGVEDWELLEIAKVYLRSFPFVGLYERWDDSINLFLFTFGLENVTANSSDVWKGSYKNKTPPQPKPANIAELKSFVDRVDWMDVKLYDYATELFDERFEAMRKYKTRKTAPPAHPFYYVVNSTVTDLPPEANLPLKYKL